MKLPSRSQVAVAMLYVPALAALIVAAFVGFVQLFGLWSIPVVSYISVAAALALSDG